MSRLHRDYLEEKVSLASEKSILLQVRAFEQKKVTLQKYNLFIIIAPQAGLFSNQFWEELRVYAALNSPFSR